MDILLRWWPGVGWLRVFVNRRVPTFHGPRVGNLVIQHSWRIGPVGFGAMWLRSDARLRRDGIIGGTT